MHRRGNKGTAVMMTGGAYRRIEPRLVQLEMALRPLLYSEGVLRDSAGRELPRIEADAEVAWAGSEVFVDRQFVPLAERALESQRLAWFQSGAAGMDHPMFRRLQERGVRVTTCDAPAEAVADFVLAGVLDHFQRGPERRVRREKGEWRPLPFREIGGSQWLVVGFGAIGQRVARRARAFGARIDGVNRSGREHSPADRMFAMNALPDALGEADVVVLCLPLDAATARLANAGFFDRMKSGSVLVNVSRGGVLDEEALLIALGNGRPAHAVLDVFAQEPLPAGHPFWTHPAVALTPHVAGMGSGLVRRSDEVFIENLGHYLRGEPLRFEKETVPAGAAVTGGGG